MEQPGVVELLDAGGFQGGALLHPDHKRAPEDQPSGADGGHEFAGAWKEECEDRTCQGEDECAESSGTAPAMGDFVFVGVSEQTLQVLWVILWSGRPSAVDRATDLRPKEGC